MSNFAFHVANFSLSNFSFVFILHTLKCVVDAQFFSFRFFSFVLDQEYRKSVPFTFLAVRHDYSVVVGKFLDISSPSAHTAHEICCVCHSNHPSHLCFFPCVSCLLHHFHVRYVVRLRALKQISPLLKLHNVAVFRQLSSSVTIFSLC